MFVCPLCYFRQPEISLKDNEQWKCSGLDRSGSCCCQLSLFFNCFLIVIVRNGLRNYRHIDWFMFYCTFTRFVTLILGIWWKHTLYLHLFIFSRNWQWRDGCDYQRYKITCHHARGFYPDDCPLVTIMKMSGFIQRFLRHSDDILKPWGSV